MYRYIPAMNDLTVIEMILFIKLWFLKLCPVARVQCGQARTEEQLRQNVLDGLVWYVEIGIYCGAFKTESVII